MFWGKAPLAKGLPAKPGRRHAVRSKQGGFSCALDGGFFFEPSAAADTPVSPGMALGRFSASGTGQGPAPPIIPMYGRGIQPGLAAGLAPFGGSSFILHQAAHQVKSKFTFSSCSGLWAGARAFFAGKSARQDFPNHESFGKIAVQDLSAGLSSGCPRRLGGRFPSARFPS